MLNVSPIAIIKAIRKWEVKNGTQERRPRVLSAFFPSSCIPFDADS